MKRQAVIIIHGIGEQRPTDTLRGFVKTIMGRENVKESKGIYSKPDDYSDLYELRRMTTTHPKTDFFEYYWAHEMSGTTLSDAINWLKVLIFRNPFPKYFPKRLLWLYLTIWLSIASIVILAIKFNLWKFNLEELQKISDFLKYFILYGVPLIFAFLSAIMIKFVGDAARYMTPAPHNISQRQAIRKNGIKLLECLHDQRELDNSFRYDRIVLVGHSLGSVIAYDLITNLWNKYNKKHNSPANPKQAVLKDMELMVEKFGNQEITELDLMNYQDLQAKLLIEQNEVGNPWRITDFITLGSPLAHARLLLANGIDNLNEKKNDRELPICPPKIEPDIQGISYALSPPYTVKDNAGYLVERTIKVLHHSAPFAVTRWVNIYFSNDYVGGPINDFGNCIENIEVKSNFFFRRIIPFISHTHYWNPTETKSIDVIRKKMKLS